jgi:glycosyltransferase involved in cell wall biosynthesis
MQAERLMVIIPDRVTDILIKGEYQPNYYNPGDLFREVHLVTTTDDRPDLGALQRTVGTAKLHLHNLPDDQSLIAANWRRWWKKPLRDWARPGVELARSIRPQLIRCHGADWNGYLASRIKKALGVPYTLSLHINPDVNSVRRVLKSSRSPAEDAHNAFFEYLEHEGLIHADLVMPVYRSILPYLARHGVTRTEVCYNILNTQRLVAKADYRPHEPFRIICVGRLFDEKNPTHLIHAVAALPGTELTIVGDGPLRPALEQETRDLNIATRVRFEPAVPNDELCEQLPGFDLFAVHTDYWELNKSVLEGLLTGLPLVINRRVGAPVPELEGADFVRFVDNSTESYRAAIADLIADDAGREALGRRAFAHAQANWSPAVTEAKVVDIYRRLMVAS